jgi:hypothetical protein
MEFRGRDMRINVREYDYVGSGIARFDDESTQRLELSIEIGKVKWTMTTSDADAFGIASLSGLVCD